MSEKKVFTNNFGKPIGNDLNTLIAGTKDPALMQDAHLLDKFTISAVNVFLNG